MLSFFFFFFENQMNAQLRLVFCRVPDISPLFLNSMISSSDASILDVDIKSLYELLLTQ